MTTPQPLMRSQRRPGCSAFYRIRDSAAKLQPPAVDADIQTLALRRLAPFRGVIELVIDGPARAASSDGWNWETQVYADRPLDLWASEAGAAPTGTVPLRPLEPGTRLGASAGEPDPRQCPHHPGGGAAAGAVGAPPGQRLWRGQLARGSS